MKRGIRIALSLMATLALPGAAGAGDAECPIFPVPKEYRAKDDKCKGSYPQCESIADKIALNEAARTGCSRDELWGLKRSA